MTIQTREEAVRRALATKTNVPSTCQLVVRGYYDAPSAGDVDHDHDDDAKDGWLSEPVSARHVGDRNPPMGYPLYYEKDGGRGNGHRTISLPGDRTRSTDFDGVSYHAGMLGNGTIAQVEKAMGVVYVGWSETIDGFLIPSESNSDTPKSRGHNVDQALKLLDKELKSEAGRHKRLVNQAKDILLKIKPK